MHHRYHYLCLALLCLIVPVSGCHSPDREQADAQRALEAELRDRYARYAEAQTLFREGIEFYEGGELGKARRRFKEAVRIEDGHASAWMALGVVEFERQRFFEAAQAFDQAAKLRPNRYEPHFNLGQVFETVGDYTKAIESYERALKLAPSRLEVMENLARSYIAEGQKRDKARELIERSLAIESRPEWRQWLKTQHQILQDP